MLLLYVICKNKAEAKKIAGMLLKLKLVACSVWWPVESLYNWKGKTVNGREVAMFLKTRKNYYKRIESIIKKVHSYETPCIMEIDVDKVDHGYLQWLFKETRII